MAEITERESDERAIRMVKLRGKGYTPAQIGRRIGMSPQFVSTATLRVRNDDLEFSGEPGAVVNQKYW